MCTSLVKLGAIVAKISLEQKFNTKPDSNVDNDAKSTAGTSSVPIFGKMNIVIEQRE